MEPLSRAWMGRQPTSSSGPLLTCCRSWPQLSCLWAVWRSPPPPLPTRKRPGPTTLSPLQCPFQTPQGLSLLRSLLGRGSLSSWREFFSCTWRSPVPPRTSLSTICSWFLRGLNSPNRHASPASLKDILWTQRRWLGGVWRPHLSWTHSLAVWLGRSRIQIRTFSSSGRTWMPLLLWRVSRHWHRASRPLLTSSPGCIWIPS